MIDMKYFSSRLLRNLLKRKHKLIKVFSDLRNSGPWDGFGFGGSRKKVELRRGEFFLSLRGGRGHAPTKNFENRTSQIG